MDTTTEVTWQSEQDYNQMCDWHMIMQWSPEVPLDHHVLIALKVTWVSHDCHMTNIRVLPHIRVTVDGINTAKDRGICRHHVTINFSGLGQRTSHGSHRRKQPQTLLDATLQVWERLQVLPEYRDWLDNYIILMFPKEYKSKNCYTDNTSQVRYVHSTTLRSKTFGSKILPKMANERSSLGAQYQ